MDKTEIIKKLINDTGLSMRTFSKKVGIPNTTLHSMLLRGIENASVNNVVKLCRALGITVEELYEPSTIGIDKKYIFEQYLKTLGYKISEDDIKELQTSTNSFIKFKILEIEERNDNGMQR